jgi:hypothetical protein
LTDQKTVRLVITILGLLAFSTVVGGICLAFTDRGLPGELIAIGSAAAGAVGGILSHTSGGDPVAVAGVDGGPVETVDVKAKK